jgi:Ser/Thr protein kinase RdoA (MazF antagonist)
MSATGPDEAPWPEPEIALSRYACTVPNPGFIARLPAGAGSRTWLVGVPPGRYVLRCLPSGVTAQRAQFTTAAHDQAAAFGLAPQIMRNDEGGLHTTCMGRHFQLVRRLDGSACLQATLARPQCRELGFTLGRLHRAIDGLQPGAEPHLKFGDDPAATLRAASAAHDHPDCPHQWVRRALALKLRRAESLDPAVLRNLANLPQQAIHGDIHPGNVVVRQQPTAQFALIDFDQARYAPRTYEVVRALIYCLQPAGQPSVFGPRASAFLDGYLAACPLSAHEIDTMDVLFETVQVLDAHGLDTCRGAPDWLLRFGQARFALLYWLRQHGSYLTAAARTAAQRTSHRGAHRP